MFRRPPRRRTDPSSSENKEGMLSIEVREPNPSDFVAASSRQSSKLEVKEEIVTKLLPSDEVEKLLKRAPKISSDDEDEKRFFQREKTMPCPKTGERIKIEFPPKVKLEKPEQILKEEEENRKELKVLRHSPQGEDLKVVPEILITFNQNMVPVTSVEKLKDLKVPCVLTPTIEGEWRWLGTKTLKWKPTHRLPKATTYTVLIPKGTKSELGCELKKELKFQFSTIPLSFNSKFPGTSFYQISPNGIIHIEFNQKINKEDVYKSLRVEANRKMFKIKPLKKDEVRNLIDSGEMKKKLSHLYSSYDNFLKKSIENQSIWFTFQEELPLETCFTCTLAKGAKSAEGNRVTKSDQHRYPRVGDKITPLQSWSISFSNNIELDDFSAEKIVKITPKVDNLKVIPSGKSITIRGQTKGCVDYIVEINQNLKDVYGQNLIQPVKEVFKVGPARQSLQCFHPFGVVVIDPTLNEDPDYSIITVNIKKIRVVVFHVHPMEYHKSRFGSDFYKYQTKNQTAEEFINAGKICYDNVIQVQGKDDEIAETRVNLVKFLQNKTTGQLIVYAEPTKDSWKGNWSSRKRVCTWIQVTKLAVQSHVTNRECYCWVTSLIDGTSVDKAKITLQTPAGKVDKEFKNYQHQIIGDKDGLALFSDYKMGSSICFVEKDKDIAFVRHIPYYHPVAKRYLNYIINDRGLYKPKETLSIKGIFRELYFKDHEKILDFPKIPKLKFEAFDSRGNKFKEGEIILSKTGCFFLEIVLPDNINLGSGYVRFTSNSPYVYVNHRFKVQEFRTPEFCSSAKVDPGPYVVNNIAIVTGKAEYYSGGGIGGCDAKWVVTQNNTSYSPPSWGVKGFSFRSNYYPYDKNGNFQSFPNGGKKDLKGFTDSSGEYKCCVDFKENTNVIVKTPVSITTNFEVQDINRQTMSSSTSFIVHPSRFYCGIKLKKYFCKVDDILPVDVVVTDIDGNIVKGVNVKVKMVLRYQVQKGYRWINKEEVVEKLELKSDEQPSELNIKIRKGGSYNIVCEIKDKFGLKNFCSTSIWCAGGKDLKKGSNIVCETVKLIANQKKYKIGEVAKILVTSPLLTPADGLLLVYSGNGFCQKEKFVLKDDNSTVLCVKISKNHIPSVLVKVYICGKNDRADETGRGNEKAPKRPAFASGTISLQVPSESQKIEMEIINKKIMKPGEEGIVDVQLKGKNVNKAKCTLIIVDEAVLALVGHKLGNPVNTFYPYVYAYSSDQYLRTSVFIKNWESIRIQGPIPPPQPCCCPCPTNCPGGGGLGGFMECFSRCCKSCDRCERKTACEKRAPRRPKPMSKSTGKDKIEGRQTGSDEIDTAIEVRKDFKPLVCFLTDKNSDENGKVSFNFKLKDNLTRYRVWVIAENTAEYFGLGESSIQSQLPVAIRPSIPRFLNFGDKSEFTVVIQNQTLEKIEVNVAVRMTNLVLLDEKSRGVKVIIPYTKRVGTKKCGKGRFQVIASVAGTKFADAVEKDLPVFTPSTSEAFATYGEVDNDGVVIQSILPPPEIYNEFGGLEISTSSTALQALTDAFLYLYNYEFNCVEQISSKMMSIFALQDILFAFNVPKMPKKSVIEAGNKKIQSAQRTDGSIGFWSLRCDVNIYLSIHVAHLQIRGIEQGYKMNDTLVNRSKSFCQNVEKYINQYCEWYGDYSRASLRSFALYTLAHYYINKRLTPHEKDNALKQAEDLYKGYEKYLSMEGKAWLIFALFYFSQKKEKHDVVVKIFKDFMNKVNVTAETANFVTSYGDDGKLVMLHSNRRTDGIILEVLMHVDPKNELVVKLVKGLLANKKKGKWNSTQENVYILLALKKYFKTYEKIVPNFVARIWLGDDYAGETKFKGRETETKIIKVPMKVIVPDDSKKDYDKKDLVLYKKGAGRMYYRIGMDYAPKSLFLKAVDYGFIVERTYEGVSDKSHVKFDEKSQKWFFKAGELIRSKLKLTNTSRRYHVALVDFIPAGCEILNPELKGTSKEAHEEKAKQRRGGGGGRGGRWGWWYWFYRPWYEHTNMRDERVEAFTSYLYCGVHEFSYLMRSTSFGEYVVPPTKAEEMYSPEIFGRSESTKVIIQ